MELFSTYYWQRGENATSLVLQQVICKEGRVPVLLACVCTENRQEDGMMVKGTGGRFCGRLADWFHEEFLPGCLKGAALDMGTAGLGLRQMAASAVREERTAGLSVAGILCAGEHFLLFYEGEQRIYLLNTRFSRSSAKCLTGHTETGILCVQEGIMQQNIALLLATEPFYRVIPEQTWKECLSVHDIREEGRAGKRLAELGEYGERQGGAHMGAVLLVSG